MSVCLPVWKSCFLVVWKLLVDEFITKIGKTSKKNLHLCLFDKFLRFIIYIYFLLFGNQLTVKSGGVSRGRVLAVDVCIIYR